MPSVKTIVRSFSGGEIAPEMYGRLDNAKFQTGLALARNGIILPHGPFAKRPGFARVRDAGVSTSPVRLIDFAYSATQTIVLEFGHLYLRFHTDGATVLLAGVPYEIASPFAAADLFDIGYTQSADVVTLVHPRYRVQELRRAGATSWSFLAPTLGSSPTAPSGITAAKTPASPTGTLKNFFYKVTSVTADGLEESLPNGPSGVVTNDLSVAGQVNTISWTAPAGLVSPSYRVYKVLNTAGRLYGFIGETLDISVVDDNISPDYSRNPPAIVVRLDTLDNYPSAVTYYEQRRVFAGTANNSQAVYMTRTATESNLSLSIPSSEGDSLSFSIKAQQQHAIRHLVPLNDLLAFTVSGIWRIFSSGNSALLPSTVAAKPQTFYGSSGISPKLTGSACLFVEANKRRVREISYSWQSQAYTSDDRSILAPHLFEGFTIIDTAYTKSPDQILWVVRSDGALLSLSYVPEHQVFAWSHHDTDGAFESVAVVSENNADRLYAVVRRTINNVATRFVERMASRSFPTQGDAFFVDCGANYTGSPITVVSGLTWLVGKTVVALADGAVVTGLVVSNAGSVTLPVAASKIQIGLPFTADMQLLPLALENAEAGGQGTTKALSYAYLRVNRTGLLKVGPSVDMLVDVPIRTNEPYDTPPRLISEQVELFVQPDWGKDAQLWVRSDTPTPLTVSAITLKVGTGG